MEILSVRDPKPEQRATIKDGREQAIDLIDLFMRVRDAGSIRALASFEVDYHLQGPTVTDAALAPLTGARGIYELHLGRTGITDAGLARMA